MITALVLLCRVAIAAVLAIAGLSKLASFAQTRESVTEFGIPTPIAFPFTVLLITCELVLAVALIPAPTAWYAGVAAVALFVLFACAIGWNLLQGRRPACNCFGQLQPAAIGWPTVARNIALAATAGLIVADPWDASVSIFTWTAAAALALVLLAANGALLVQVLRQQGRMLMRFESIEQHLGMRSEPPQQHFGLEPGTQAPAFAGLQRLLEPQRPLLVVFTDPDCGPCQVLAPQIARWQEELRDRLTIATLSHDAEGGRETAEAYEAWGTPAAVLVAPDGRIASYVAQGADAISALVDAVQIAKPAISPGDDAPDLVVRTLDGKEVALASLRGAPALLVFWSEDCGFCQRMRPDLRGWEILVPINDNADAAAAFGAAGTPMGVLIDAQGRIASPLVAGAKEIFALAPLSNGRTEHGSLV